ncbi:MAG: hypothetical protein WBF66_04360, partial [Dehalococcoidia bacterium]
TEMKSMTLVPLLGAALLITIIVAPMAEHARHRSAQADPLTVVGYDMNTSGNTATSLGAIDGCISVSSTSEDEFEVDIFLDGLATDSVLGFGYDIVFPDWAVQLVAQDHLMLTNAAPGSAGMDMSEAIPDASSPHLVTVVDTGSAEYNPPYSEGVLGRYTFKVLSTASAGVYALTLTKVVVGRDTMADPNHPGYPVGDPLPLDAIWDGYFDPPYGVIAVDVACGSAPPIITPTPTATPTPTPTPTATVTPTLTPAPTPTPPDLVAGWNHACYVGADLPISQALADLGASVLAVYRLRPDQGYDKWFPSRPDISTITTLSPYEALFMLMANDAIWPQEPTAAPPTGLDLTQGWNSACYCGQAKDVQSATASIAGQYGVLYLLAPGQGWKRFIPARPEISNLAELQRFAAVLILISQPEGTHWVFAP